MHVIYFTVIKVKHFHIATTIVWRKLSLKINLDKLFHLMSLLAYLALLFSNFVTFSMTYMFIIRSLLFICEILWNVLTLFIVHSLIFTHFGFPIFDNNIFREYILMYPNLISSLLKLVVRTLEHLTLTIIIQTSIVVKS